MKLSWKNQSARLSNTDSVMSINEHKKNTGFGKETPIGKELLIWFAIATILAFINWFLNHGKWPDVPYAGFRMLILQLSYTYFIFLHILLLVWMFGAVLWDRVKSTGKLLRHGSGLLFALLGFALGLFNMQWFSGFAFEAMYPGFTLNIQIAESIGYSLVAFVVVAMVGTFAVSYHTMRLNLKESYHIQLERERLRSELEMAREMQMGLMPSAAPDLPGYDIAGVCLPATEVGGDYFDFIRLDGEENALAIAVADVSGKGMKAAMTAVMVSGMLHAEAIQRNNAAEVMIRVNRPLHRKSDRRMFAAMLYGILDPGRKEFSFTNAGQMPPLLLRAGKVAAISSHGPRLPLGATPEVHYARKTLELASGDHLLLYTDGINEARNGDRLLFGEERLQMALAESARAPSAAAALDMIHTQIREFTGDEPPHDDITMVLLRVS
jgi:serine phosphatase RsbU (regulator of sigma subunit)